MRTIKKELLKMMEEASDNTPIILRVRGNSTTDYYTTQEVVAYVDDDGRLIIQDKLSH